MVDYASRVTSPSDGDVEERVGDWYRDKDIWRDVHSSGRRMLVNAANTPRRSRRSSRYDRYLHRRIANQSGTKLEILSSPTPGLFRW